jgi:hypothetical protein
MELRLRLTADRRTLSVVQGGTSLAEIDTASFEVRRS